MNAIEAVAITNPVVLIFSAMGKLVSFSSELKDDVEMGQSFAFLFSEKNSFPSESFQKNTLFSVLMEEQAEGEKLSPPKEICFMGEAYSYASHLMKDPSEVPLALVLTLIPLPKKEWGLEDEKIAHMDRLAQMGELTASLAHEIRNPLAGIHANIQVLGNTFPKEDERQAFVNIVLDEVGRVEAIIKDLLNYSKLSKPILASLSLRVVLTQVQTLLKAQLKKKNVSLILDFKDSDSSISGDAAQLTQVFLNLILNSSQAMPDGGEIHIQTKMEPDHLTVHLKDSGVGMDSQTISKMFDPFFTTRSKGLGLGLSVVHKIVKEHKGTIQVSSQKEQGTSMIVRFPVA